MELFIYFGTIYVFYVEFGECLTGKRLSGMKPF